MLRKKENIEQGKEWLGPCKKDSHVDTRGKSIPVEETDKIKALRQKHTWHAEEMARPEWSKGTRRERWKIRLEGVEQYRARRSLAFTLSEMPSEE